MNDDGSLAYLNNHWRDDGDDEIIQVFLSIAHRLVVSRLNFFGAWVAASAVAILNR